MRLPFLRCEEATVALVATAPFQQHSIRTLSSLISLAKARELCSPLQCSPEHLYPNPLMVTGLIAYGSWLLIAAREGQPSPAKRVAEVLFVIALLFIIAFPLLAGYIRAVDIIGSILFAGACFSAGVFVAQLCGVDLFKRDDASAG